MVPNLLPRYWPETCRIAIVGDVASYDDEKIKRPFSGTAGYHLNDLLNQASFPDRSYLFMGNVVPYNVDPINLNWDSPEVKNGLSALREQLQSLKPHITILCGNIPLKAARDPERLHPLKPKMFMYKIGNWRGSLFISDCQTSPMYGLKCMGTHHPSYAIRDYSVNPLIIFDLKRAKEESSVNTLTLPKRELVTSPSPNEILHRLQSIRTKRALIALDIEGGLGTMSCISFATSPYEAFIVPFYKAHPLGKKYYWDGETGPKIWRALAETLEDPLVPKILQNSLYDRFVLEYGYKIRVANVVGDTMLSGWEIYSQMKKKLSLQASIWTREPYWKGDRLQVEEEE